MYTKDDLVFSFKKLSTPSSVCLQYFSMLIIQVCPKAISVPSVGQDCLSRSLWTVFIFAFLSPSLLGKPFSHSYSQSACSESHKCMPSQALSSMHQFCYMKNELHNCIQLKDCLENQKN